MVVLYTGLQQKIGENEQPGTYVVFWLPVSVPYTGGALVRMVRVRIGGGS